MRYSILAFKFVGKNFLYLLVLTAVPAVYLAWYYSSSSFSMFLNNTFFGISTQDKFNFNIYYNFSLISNMNWPFAIPALLIILLTITLVFAYVNRTMKVGVKSLKMPFLRLNQTIIPVFLVAVTLFIIYQLFGVFATLIVNLLLVTENPLLYRLLIPVSLIALYFLFFLIFLLLMMSAPTMLITGYKFRESVSYSVKLSKKRIFKLGLACLVALVPILLMNVGLNFLTSDLWLKILFGSIFISFILMYLPALMMATYYDIEGINRNDIKRKPKYY